MRLDYVATDPPDVVEMVSRVFVRCQRDNPAVSGECKSRCHYSWCSLRPLRLGFHNRVVAVRSPQSAPAARYASPVRFTTGETTRKRCRTTACEPSVEAVSGLGCSSRANRIPSKSGGRAPQWGRYLLSVGLRQSCRFDWSQYLEFHNRLQSCGFVC